MKKQNRYSALGKAVLAGTVLVAVAGVALTPATSRACACGCGVFDVGTSALLPTQVGGRAFLEYDFMNQDQCWHGTSSTSSSTGDKDIRTSFITAGMQYMFDREWGMEAQVPYAIRHVTTHDPITGDLVDINHEAFGDLTLKGIYSGFSPDMSSGVTFGLKLPTGDYTQSGFDRDTEIGMGSTDILLGGYHMGNLAGRWDWFANVELDQPVLIQKDYRPGGEADVVTGVYYDGWRIGDVKVAPIAQVIGSFRMHDRGSASDPDNSGYERILLSPGIEVSMAGLRIYGDVGVPVYDHVRGNQLVAAALFKLNVSHDF